MAAKEAGTGTSIRSESFEDIYANNIQFEASTWDLKLIFGQTDQHQGRVDIQQHTAVTIPWAQSKLLIYFLQINLYIHERTNGKIALPEAVLPPEIPPDFLGSDPEAVATVEHIRKLREELIASFSQ